MRSHLRRFRSTYSVAAVALATAGMVAAGATPATATTYLYNVTGSTAPGGAFTGSSPHPVFKNAGYADVLSCATASFSGSMPNVTNSAGAIGTFSGYTFAQCTLPSGPSATVTATVHPATLTVTGGETVSGTLPMGTLSLAVNASSCSYTLTQASPLSWQVNRGSAFQSLVTFTPENVKGSCGLIAPIVFAHGGTIQPNVTSHPA